MFTTSEYKEFKYLFPPRPENASSEASIPTLERMGMVAEPKLNGSCAVVFMNGEKVIVMSRHKDEFSSMKLDTSDIAKLYRGNGWMVLVGEYMNKSKKNGSGELFNNKLVIFDMLVYNGEYLTGTTSEDRRFMLSEMYAKTDYDGWISSIDGTSDCYIVNPFKEGLLLAWRDIIKIDMYEGFVFKRPGAKLEAGYSMKNNTTWQSKVRKPTKNYSH